MSEIAVARPFAEEENFSIKKFYSNGKDYLHFTFKNKFTEHASEIATKEWSDCCKRNPEKKFVHIWDCQSMSGFDKKAKDLWMEHMKKLNDQTDRIILVSDNILIRGAARIMSKFTKLHLEVYKDIGEMSRQGMR